MRVVKIFISALEDLFKEDRVQIDDFLGTLNNIYEGSIYFKACDYEDILDSSLRYVEEIKKSDLIFILLAKEINCKIKGDIDFALENYNNAHASKVVFYFKKNFVGEPSQSITEFKEYLCKKAHHYYSYYDNIDTLKLGILMHIKLLDLDRFDLKFQEDEMFVQKNPIMFVDKLPMFLKNDVLKTLYKEIRVIENEYSDVIECYNNNPNDINICNKIEILSNEKDKIEKEIAAQKNRILLMLEDMFEQTSKEGLSERQIIGYQLFEQGKLKESLDVLDYNNIMIEAKFNEKLINFGKKGIETNVNELLQRIKILKSLPKTKDNNEEIDKIYKNICELANKNDLGIGYHLEYGNYLYNSEKYHKAESIIKKAIFLFKYTNDKKHINSYIDCLKLLVNIYIKTDQISKIEEVKENIRELSNENILIK